MQASGQTAAFDSTIPKASGKQIVIRIEPGGQTSGKHAAA